MNNQFFETLQNAENNFYGKEERCNLINPVLIDPIIKEPIPKSAEVSLVNPIVVDGISEIQENTDAFTLNTIIEHTKPQLINPIEVDKKITLVMDSKKDLKKLQEVEETENTPSKNLRIVSNIGMKISKVEPFDVAKMFLQRIKILIKNERFFVFNYVFYEETSKANLCRICLDQFRIEVSNNGKPKFVDDVIDFLYKEPSIVVKEDEIPDNFVAFNDVLLDTASGNTLRHTPDLAVFYKINAKISLTSSLSSPLFDIFLSRISGNDSVLCQRIYELIGYCLTPDVSAKCLFLLQGVQNSGKSVLCNFIYKLFSKNSVITLDVHDFNREFIISELAEKALCLSPDLPAEPLDSKSTSKLKQLTGADEVSSNVKYKSYTQFRTRAKIILATNHPLLTKKSDVAFFERVVTIPFAYSIAKDNRDPELISKLMMERDVIVSKAISSYFLLRRKSYNFSSNYPVNAITADTVESGESIEIKIFNFAKKYFCSDSDGIVFTNDAYEAFCEEVAEITLNDFINHFTKILYENFDVKKSRKRKPGAVNATSCFLGIKWNAGN